MLTLVIGVYLFFPETNGRRLEEVDQLFTQSKNIFDTVPVSKHMLRGSFNYPVGIDSDKNEAIHTEKGEQAA